jgi:small subunit ribosomal protein S20
MANTASAQKRVRQAHRRWLRNRRFKSEARTYVKKARLAIDSGDATKAQEAIRQAYSALDRAASKGVIHRNNAARRKSRLVAQLQRGQAH